RDVVIGSRYVPGGAVRNWGILRQFISRGGSLYARLILWFALKDWTGGFNLWSRKALEGLGLDSVRSEGYSFQIELKYRALKRGFSHSEVPILFEDRRVGQSKMSSRIFLEALLRVWQIRFRS
ncbi:MAG: polyprenol monophosphomannose synthase, partial [Bdellovibrionales bacterium]|nr:polyprenol monophosphomannose synthase [Bdellovibrionales bacterium]